MGTQMHQSIWGCYFLPNCHGRTREDAACDHVFLTMGSNCQHSGTTGTALQAQLGWVAERQSSNTGEANSIHGVTLWSDRSVTDKFGQLQS